MSAGGEMGAVSWSGVAFAHPDSPVSLGELDLSVDAGDVVLVLGDSGSGKSTLLRTVNGLVPHSSGGSFRGTVTVSGRSTSTSRPRDLTDVVGFVHQTPEAQFVVDHVEHDIAFALENLGLDQATMRRRVEEVLDALGIAHLRHRSPAALSGGERQRAAIAGALAAAPSVLVLDEPTSMLDPQGADDVLGAIRRLNDDLGTTILVAEHRLERAAPLADRAVVLAGGRIIDDGDPSTVLPRLAGAPVVTRLGHLLGWDPAPLTVRDARHALRRHGTPSWASDITPDDLGDLLTTGRNGDGNSHPAPTPGERLITARGLTARHGSTTVVNGVDLDLHAGEIVAVLGRNGSGKTSLLRALVGAHAPSAGSVEPTVPVAYVPQEPDSLLYAATVRGELEATLRLLKRSDAAVVEHWLDVLRLGDLADRTRGASRSASASGSPSPRLLSVALRPWCWTSRLAASTRHRSTRSKPRWPSIETAAAPWCWPPTMSNWRHESRHA